MSIIDILLSILLGILIIFAASALLGGWIIYGMHIYDEIIERIENVRYNKRKKLENKRERISKIIEDDEGNIIKISDGITTMINKKENA